MIRSAARISLPSSPLIKIIPALRLTCAALAYFSFTNRTPVHAATLDRAPAIPGGFNFCGAAPTLAVGPRITGTFNAANSQNGAAAFTITGGGILNWGQLPMAAHSPLSAEQ